MKNLLEIAKIFVLAFLIIVPAKVSAVDYYSVPVTDLKDIVGNWYDTKGNLVLTISSDYKINGCSIMSVGFTGDSAAFYKIKINEGGSYKDIEIRDDGYIDYHKHLLLNESTYLRSSKNPKYIESVGGIYLGMGKNEVLKLYGEPSKIENNYDYDSTWKYNNDGFDVMFAADAVIRIKIYSYGTRKFDWSGLSAKNSESEFARKYNCKILNSSRGNETTFLIGHGEAITIENSSVTLFSYPDGYFGRY